MDEHDELPLIDFERLASHDDLPPWLGMTPDDVRELLDEREESYNEIYLAKKGGGTRVVYRVDGSLGAVQRQIARSIQAVWQFEEHVHGYVKGRSSTTNAAQHLARRVLLRVDLHDFFGSITELQIKDAFVRLGVNGSAVDSLAQLCTFNGRLPAGASSSPSLANMVAEDLDRELVREAERIGCTYTRYGDDMVFSGDAVPDPQRIDALAKTHKFSLNHSKTRRQFRGRPQYVCGLTVADKDHPRIPSSLKRYLRTALHFAEKFGLSHHVARTNRNRIDEARRLFGLIAYVNAVEPKLGERFRSQYDEALRKDRESGPDHGKTVSRP